MHLIVDNYATHKHSKVRTWLAQQPRYHIHYTPTYSSWLNQVERWFGLITQRAIPPRLLQQRQRFDRKDRLLCPALQSLASTLRLDRYSGFHPGKDLSTLFSYFGTRQ